MGCWAFSVPVMGLANKGRERLPAPCSCFCKTILSGPSSSGHSKTWLWRAFRSFFLLTAGTAKPRHPCTLSSATRREPRAPHPTQPERNAHSSPSYERTGLSGPFSVNIKARYQEDLYFRNFELTSEPGDEGDEILVYCEEVYSGQGELFPNTTP